MLNRSLLLPASVLLTSSAVLAAPQGFDARSKAMGGASVASSRHWSAPLNNPALLAVPRDKDDFGLVVPTFFLEGRNAQDLTDKLTDFTEAYDDIEQRFDDLDPPSNDELDNLANQLEALDGSTLRFDVQAGLAMTIPSENFGIGIMMRGDLSGVGLVTVDDDDLDLIRNAGSSADLDNLESLAQVSAGARREIGIALASQFDVGFPISIGITPKSQTIETFNYVTTPDDFEEDDSGNDDVDFTDDQYRSDQSAFNIDLGLAVQPTESWTIGLTVNDLISQEIDSVVTLGQQFQYEVAPVATIGTAWSTGTWTFAADVDLTERDPIAFSEPSQFVSVGAELAGSWAQLRAGFRHDLQGGTEDVVTAGLGVSPFGVLRVDLAGLVGEDTYGAALALSVTF